MPVLGDSTSTYVAEREGSLSMLAIHAYTHVLLRYHYTVPILVLGRTLIPLVLLYVVYITTVSGQTYEPTPPCTSLMECLIPMTWTQRSYWWIFVAALVLLMTFMTSLPHLDRREPR
jgi:hypothetical protein